MKSIVKHYKQNVGCSVEDKKIESFLIFILKQAKKKGFLWEDNYKRGRKYYIDVPESGEDYKTGDCMVGITLTKKNRRNSKI